MLNQAKRVIAKHLRLNVIGYLSPLLRWFPPVHVICSFLFNSQNTHAREISRKKISTYSRAVLVEVFVLGTNQEKLMMETLLYSFTVLIFLLICWYIHLYLYPCLLCFGLLIEFAAGNNYMEQWLASLQNFEA